MNGFATDEELAIEMIVNEDWDDIVDEYPITELTERHEIIDIWECE